MFGVAFWSESRKRLVLARDRVGIKPLYIACRAGEIYFGSELKTILIHPEIERQLDRAALDCYLSLNYVPGPRTLIAGVEKLEPGHWLEDGATAKCERRTLLATAGRMRLQLPWTLDFGFSLCGAGSDS